MELNGLCICSSDGAKRSAPVQLLTQLATFYLLTISAGATFTTDLATAGAAGLAAGGLAAAVAGLAAGAAGLAAGAAGLAAGLAFAFALLAASLARFFAAASASAASLCFLLRLI